MSRLLLPTSFFFVLGVVAGCSSEKSDDDANPTPTPTATPTPPDLAAVTIALARGSGDDVDVTIHVVGSAGDPVTSTSPTVSVLGGTASAVVNAGGGDYTTTVTADVLDSEVQITATSTQASATKTALVFSTLDASLGQPELVDGLVNTPAWEDGVAVSPDGQWLIVASYLPVDALSCIISGGLPSSPPCATLIGPYDAPARPGMLGASRMNGTTYENVCPAFGITVPSTTFTFMPSASYGFRRQSDGSFTEPFVIGYEADGCLSPYGFTFTAAPVGVSATMVFAQHDPFKGGPDTDHDLYYTPITLGQPNILGTYSQSMGMTVRTGEVATLLPPVTSIRQGNPHYAAGRMWWDNEDPTDIDRDLVFSDITGTFPAITATSGMTVGMSMPGQEEIQPMIDGNDLYFMGGGTLYRSTLTAAANPALAGSWSARQALLGPTTTTNIIATGEPNIARTGGQTELYFVFVKKTSTGGLDAGVARVPFN